MRILVVTRGTMPGYSGGWTTPLDLLQPDHEVAYLTARGPSGRYVLEDVPVYTVPRTMRFERDWPFLNRIRIGLAEKEFRHLLRTAWNDFEPDFALCLDEYCAGICMDSGLPYAVRLHSRPTEHAGEDLDRILRNALFSTICPSVNVEGYEVMKHAVDLERFGYTEHDSAERVIMVSTLNVIRAPELFVEGVALSGIRGAIVGDGDLRDSVIAACRRTGGRVEYIPPVTRRKLPELLRGYQIGVACHRKVDIIYQMKVNEYMASGIYPLVMPWTHLATEAPDLTMTFETPGELAERIDWLVSHWSETLVARRKSREFVLANYGIDEPRKRFAEILRETFGDRAGTSPGSS